MNEYIIYWGKKLGKFKSCHVKVYRQRVMGVIKDVAKFHEIMNPLL